MSQRLITCFGCGIISAILLTSSVSAQSSHTWTGGGGDNNWSTAANWSGGAPDGNDIINFAGTTRLNNTNNLTIAGFRLFFNSGAGAFTLSGNSIRFFDFGGNDPKIENNSANSQTINFNIEGDGDAADPLEINPVDGDLTLNGTVNNFGSNIRVFGNNDKTLILNNVVSGSGKLIVEQNSRVVLNASNTYTGNTEINAGQIRIGLSGDIAAGSSIFVGNGTTPGTAARLFLNSDANGKTFSRTININPGDGTSGNRELGFLSTTASDVGTFSGNIVRATGADNRALSIFSAGARVVFSGVISGDDAVILNGPGVVEYRNAMTYTGDTSIRSGELRIGESASIAGGTLFVGDGTLLSTTATLTISDPDGSTSVARPIQVNASSGAQFRNIGGSNTTGINTFSGAVTLQSSARLFAASGGTVDFTGVISQSSGTHGITKVGAGTVRLGGANTYQGQTTVDAGTLTITASDRIHDSSPMAISSGATFNLNNFNEEVGNFLSSAGNVVLGSGQFRVNQTSDETFSGVMSGSGSFVKKGTAKLTMSGANTYTGDTFVDQGTLEITGDLNSAEVEIGSSLFLGSTATLTLAGSGATLNDVRFNPSNTSGDRILAVTAGNHSIGGTLTVDRDDAKINVNAGSLVINNLDLATGAAGDNQVGGGGDQDVIITVASGASASITGVVDAVNNLSFIDKHGGGTLFLTGNNSGKTFSINTFAGTLSVNSGNAFGTGHAHNLSFMSNSALHVSANSTVSSAHRFRIDNAVNATIDVDLGVTFTMNGIITNLTGSGNLIKRGSGTLVLTATNGYSGTTLVDVGTLVVNGSIASSSLTTVDAGGFLKGSGQVGALTIDNGGAFSPGNSPGTLYAGNTTWNNGGSYIWEINDVDAGAGTDPGWDLLDITGTLNVVSNFTIYVTSLTLGNAPGNVHDFNSASSYTWKVAQTTGGVLNFSPGDILLNLSGFSNPYSGSWSVTVDANNVYVNYFGALSIVPEPSAVFLLVVGAGLCYRRWRTRR